MDRDFDRKCQMHEVKFHIERSLVVKQLKSERGNENGKSTLQTRKQPQKTHEVPDPDELCEKTQRHMEPSGLARFSRLSEREKLFPDRHGQSRASSRRKEGAVHRSQEQITF